jgi:hypothetical protein
VICGRFCAIRRPRNAGVGEYRLKYRSVAAVGWVHIMRWSVMYFAVITASDFLLHKMSLPIGPHCTATKVFVVFLLKSYARCVSYRK